MNSMGFAADEQVTPSWSCSWSWSWAYRRSLAARSLLVSCRYSGSSSREWEGEGRGKQRHCIFPAAIVFLIKRCHMLRVSLLSQCLIADNAQGAEAKRSHHKASQAKAACQLSLPPLPALPSLLRSPLWSIAAGNVYHLRFNKAHGCISINSRARSHKR